MNAVLLVDDKEENLHLLRAVLEGYGHAVDTARDGAEALAKARRTAPRLVISDLLMPVMDGYTLLRHWKADERLKLVPFVVYTATYTEPEDERLALNLGADAFILKPTEPEPFMARIQEVLAKASQGELLPACAPRGEGQVLLKEYNEVLIRKLEQKAFQLEHANRALREEIAQRQEAEAEARHLQEETEQARAAVLRTLEYERKAQAALRSSEERLRLAIESADLGTWHWNLRTGELVWSDRYLDMFGLPVGEAMTYQKFLAALHPEDRDRADAAVRRAMQDRIGYDIELRNVWPDGSVHWAACKGHAYYDDAGLPLHMQSVALDITERKEAEEALRRYTVELHELSRRLIETEETEHRKLNRELHDRVGQNLSVINLNLNYVRGQLPAQSLAAVGPRFDEVQTLLEATVRQVRDVMAELRPPALDDYGLFAALRGYAEPLAQRLGMAVAVRGGEVSQRLPFATEIALFRIAQEALTNIAKHARAKRIDISLAAGEAGVTLTVTDDGVGFDAARAADAASWGIRIMRERAEAVGAAVRVESAPGQGTRVTVAVALEIA